MILDYSFTKGCVDSCDKMCEAYSVFRSCEICNYEKLSVLYSIHENRSGL